MLACPARLSRLIRRLWAEEGGNVLMLTGFGILLLTFAVGMGIDYSHAEQLQTKALAAADAAALAAVDPSMISMCDTAAIQAAQQMFDEQVANIPGMKITSRTVTISPSPPPPGACFSPGRTVTVNFAGTSVNTFAGILRLATLPISGSAVANASQPPSFNFYIAMDTSPSMLLPTTTDGITNLTKSAIWSGEMPLYGRIDGCDFACHSTNMQQWNRGTFVIDLNKKTIYTDPAGNDFYRVDCSGNVFNSSGTQLGSNAQIRTASGGSGTISNTYCTNYGSSTVAPAANPVYIYYLPNGQRDKPNNYVSTAVNFPDTYWLAQNFSHVNPGASNITLRTDAEEQAAGGVISYAYGVAKQYDSATAPPVYKMQFFTFNQSGSTAPVSTAPFGTMTDVKTLQNYNFPDISPMVPNMASALVSNPYTSFTTMLTYMKATIPLVNGTGAPTSPQNVLIIITDGMVDDATGISQFANTNITQCNTIKTTGARIAILYTQYIPETINYTRHPTFNTVANNYVPNIQSQLQACATQNADGTYLMQTVSTDGNVASALNSLFAQVVKSARLVQ